MRTYRSVVSYRMHEYGQSGDDRIECEFRSLDPTTPSGERVEWSAYWENDSDGIAEMGKAIAE